MARSRRFLRLHLSTLVVLSLAAGGLLWLNLKPHTVLCTYGIKQTEYEPSQHDRETAITIGLPAKYRWPKSACTVYRENTLYYYALMYTSAENYQPMPPTFDWDLLCVLLDLGAAVACMGMLAILLEWHAATYQARSLTARVRSRQFAAEPHRSA